MKGPIYRKNIEIKALPVLVKGSQSYSLNMTVSKTEHLDFGVTALNERFSFQCYLLVHLQLI